MQNAPSVSYPVGRFRWRALPALSLSVLSGCALLLWTLWAPASMWQVAGGCAWLLAVLVNVSGSDRWMSLRWDGHDWWVVDARGHERAVTGLEPGLDLRSALLARLGGIPGGWVWLCREAEPVTWGELRRAVYSRARRDPPEPAGASTHS